MIEMSNISDTVAKTKKGGDRKYKFKKNLQRISISKGFMKGSCETGDI